MPKDDSSNIPTLPPFPSIDEDVSQVAPTQESQTDPSFDIPTIVSTKPKSKFGGKKLAATIVGILLLIGGVAAGVILVGQQQEIRERAQVGGVEPSSRILNTSGNPILSIQCGQEYILQTSINYPANSNQHYKDHRSWINHQGTNAGQERGLFHWASDRSSLPAGSIQCECGNNGQCALGGGYAVVESGNEYVELARCTAWSNTSTNTGPANHAVNFFFKPKDLWGTGPTTQNDISTYGINVQNNILDWTNSDINFSISNCTPPVTAQCTNINAWDTDWVLLTPTDLTKLKTGDVVRFVVAGQASTGTFDKAKFTINGTQLPETTALRPGTTNEFYTEYTVPAGTASFTVNAQIHHLETDQWY